MMHKLIITSILIFNMLLLSSCSLGWLRKEMLTKSSDDIKADARLEQVLKAIKSQDKDALHKIFSKQALNEADDFNRNVDNLFEFFQGEVDSWKKSSGPTVFDSSNFGRITKKKVSSYYYVNTDKQQYFFLLDDFPIDTRHPDNAGLYLLLVVKAEDREKIYDGGKKILYDGDKAISRAGIYLPIK